MNKIFFPRGSIMIWTLLLGITLAVVFFFFSQRLNLGVASQRKTMEYLNARLLIDSYADYLESLSLGELNEIKAAGGTINFQGIAGALTNDVSEIVGAVDANGESARFHLADTVDIAWNLCSQNFQADLIAIDNSVKTLYEHDTESPSCPSSSAGYDDETLAVNASDLFSLKSNGAPFYFSIKSTSGKFLPGEEWQLNLEYPLSFRKKITVSRTFTPAP